MGVFGKIKDAKPSQGGVYILPGVYKVQVQACKAGQARDGRDFFVAELLVLESDNPDRPVGCSMSWMQMVDKRYEETALGNIKTFISVLTQTPSHEVDEAGVELIVSAANPCAGMMIKASAVNITTKKGDPFTKVTWLPAS